MSISINSNPIGLGANRQMNSSSEQVTKTLLRLATGYKINSAADDAAGLAISQKLLSQLNGLNTASTNAQDGISLSQTADGAMAGIQDMLGRMAELAGRASNGIMGESERAALQSEMDSLQSEIDRVAQSTNFNGKKLLDGSLTDGLKLSVGSGSGSADTVEFSVGNMSAEGLGVSGFDLSTTEGALAALEKLNGASGAINKVSAARGDVGAVQNRLEHTVNNLDVTYENTLSANSRIRDADMAKEMIAFTQNQVMLNVAQAMQAHSNMQAQSVLQIMR